MAAHGIKGDVKLKSYTEHACDVDKYGELENANADRKFTIKVLGFAKGLLRVKIEGVNNRNDAEALVDTELYVNRSAFPKLADDEYYLSDLVGFKVCLQTPDNIIGKVIGFSDFGAGKIMEIKLQNQSDTQMLPFTKEYVPDINLEEEYVVVSSPTMNYASDDYELYELEKQKEG